MERMQDPHCSLHSANVTSKSTLPNSNISTSEMAAGLREEHPLVSRFYILTPEAFFSLTTPLSLLHSLSHSSPLALSPSFPCHSRASLYITPLCRLLNTFGRILYSPWQQFVLAKFCKVATNNANNRLSVTCSSLSLSLSE